LTRECRERARELGLGAIGFASYDPKYTFAEYEGHQCGDRVIICLLEQNYAATEATPSVLTNKAAYDSEAEVQLLSARLAAFLHERGYRAKAHATHEAVMIPYAVQAGLGQLGLNGQLLSPAAGSRCRLGMVSTEAPLVLDRPVDYGVARICDACQACVRRCPAGAIPKTRAMHRGIEKAKINTERCFPVTAQAAGCGVCMKVCPVQRYGLAAVLDEYGQTGQILGQGTDELEGYDWPLDGRHYGPGDRPALSRAFFAPPGFGYDPKRKLPVIQSQR
jgi:ferredoxin